MNRSNTVFIDASGEEVKVAKTNNGIVSACKISNSQAMETFIETLSKVAGDISKIDAFAICEGPGSILGMRFASVFISTISRLQQTKIFVWDVMQATAFAIANESTNDAFTIVAPSRKGFANILKFSNGKIDKQKEIEISEIANAANEKIFLLNQRKKVDEALLKYERIDVDFKKIAETLLSKRELLRECDSPPDAKSLTKREYVKWKAQAHT